MVESGERGGQRGSGCVSNVTMLLPFVAHSRKSQSANRIEFSDQMVVVLSYKGDGGYWLKGGATDEGSLWMKVIKRVNRSF